MRVTPLLGAFLALTVTAALAGAGPAAARPCLDCEDPELPGPGGPNCPTIAATTEPWISAGTVRVGEPVTGHRGTWTNAVSSGYTHRWMAGGAPATPVRDFNGSTATYVPVAADLGKRLRLRVTARGTDQSCTGTEYSEESAAVAQGVAPVPQTSPAVTGTLRVGGTLTAAPGTWTPAADSVAFSWWRGTTQVGSGAQYTPVAADHGVALRMRATAVRAGHAHATRDVTTGLVADGAAVVPSDPPRVQGTPVVGLPLTVTTGSWTPAADTVSFTWWRGATQVGTGAQYTPVAADLAGGLRVDVLARRDGHLDARHGVPVGPVRPGAAATVVTAPRVQGTPVFGAPLQVLPGQWSAPGTERYQWQRSGQPIPGATGAGYTPIRTDVGHPLSVIVTLEAAGRIPATAQVLAGTTASAPAPVWSTARLRLKGRDRVRGTLRVALSAAAVRAAAAAPDATVTYQWIRNARALPGQTGRGHRVTRADLRRRLRVQVTVSRPGHLPLVLTSVAVRVTGKGRKIR